MIMSYLHSIQREINTVLKKMTVTTMVLMKVMNVSQLMLLVLSNLGGRHFELFPSSPWPKCLCQKKEKLRRAWKAKQTRIKTTQGPQEWPKP